MNCRCHGEPAYWQKDARIAAGGWWECAVKRRERERQRYADPAVSEQKRERQLARYDADPVYRIEKNLRNDARRRALTLKRRREQHGPLPLEGLDRPRLEPHQAQAHT